MIILMKLVVSTPLLLIYSNEIPLTSMSVLTFASYTKYWACGIHSYALYQLVQLVMYTVVTHYEFLRDYYLICKSVTKQTRIKHKPICVVNYYISLCHFNLINSGN